MAIIWKSNLPLGAAWDVTNPKNLVWNKSLQQNLNELNVGMQVMGMALPEALAYKAAGQIQAGLAAKAINTASTTTTAAATSGGVAGAGTAIGGLGGAGILAAATTGAKLGFDVYLLEWLKNNWWIIALFGGLYLATKVVGKK